MGIEFIIGLIILVCLAVWAFLVLRQDESAKDQVLAPWPFPVSQVPPQAAPAETPAPAPAPVAESVAAETKAPVKKARKTAARKTTKKAK